MSLVRSIPFGSRRVMLIALAAGVAVLLTLALTIEPASRQVSDPSGGRTSTDDSALPTGGDSSTSTIDPASPISGTVEPSSGGEVEFKVQAEESAGGAGVARDAAIGIAPADSIVAPESNLDAPSLDAKVIRTASMELKLTRGHFEDGWSDAHAVAGAFGGYVVTASRSGAGDGPRAGTITLRVPSARFAAAVERLRELDHTSVERDDMSSQDVTQEFVDVRSRLRHDRAVEGRLLALLAETKGVSEVLAVQTRLDQVQEQIELSRGRLEYLGKLTAMSTIEVSMHEPGAKNRDRDETDESVLGDAWGDARERFSENVASAIVWTGGALPTLLALLLAGFIARLAWRRRTAQDHRTEVPGADS